MKILFKKGKGLRTVSAKFLDENTAQVTFPRNYSLKDAEMFVKKHQAWLDKARKKFIAKIPILTENKLFLQNKYLDINLYKSSVNKGVRVFYDKIIVSTDSLIKVNQVLLKFLKNHTEKFLSSYSDVFDEYDISEIRVKFSKNRWGTCSSKRVLTFHPFLFCLPLHLREYIIYHEIAHLYEMNHSKRFKFKLGELIPDFKAREKELKKFILS